MACSCDKNKMKVPGMSSGSGKKMTVAKKTTKKATKVTFSRFKK